MSFNTENIINTSTVPNMILSNNYANTIGMGNQNMQQMMMMIIFPIITSAFGTIFQSLISDIRNVMYKLFAYLYVQINKLSNKYIFKIYDEINELHIPLMETTATYDRVSETISPEGLPIIWYINSKTMLESNKVKIAKTFEHSGIFAQQPNLLYSLGAPQQQDQKPIKKSLLFVPMSRQLQNIQSGNPLLSKNNKDDKDSLDAIGSAEQKIPNQDLSSLTEIDKDIYMDLELKQNQAGSLTTGKSATMLVLKSKKKSVIEMGKFYLSVKEEYEKITSDKSGKLYVYNGSKASPQFGCYSLDTSQSFDNIFIENKESIISDILSLNDKEYYKEYGMKRKIGHLYVGPPGSGKTCFVTAIAKLTGRSVVYIPISRIQHNAELQSIIYDRKFNGVQYNMDEVIFIADELDSLNSSLALKKSINKEPEIEQLKSQTVIIKTDKSEDNSQPQQDQEFDKLNIGMVLNVLDGNNDQDGMIIIGTANNYEKLDPAIYRNGRLELIKFKYMGRTEIVNMIEHYYKTTLTTEQREKIRDDRTVQSLNLKNVCLKYIQKKKQSNINIDDLIDEINYMFDHVDEVNEIIEKHILPPALDAKIGTGSKKPQLNDLFSLMGPQSN